jgi:hypothetical protein
MTAGHDHDARSGASRALVSEWDEVPERERSAVMT